ncbi:hypothetical protein [Flavobacterium sp.]|jgi:hypothetical protein|uniref:hypothetical protein n=1 Tax=Flavobacterium sp. TaxID=239 RepID=UPI0037BE641D
MAEMDFTEDLTMKPGPYDYRKLKEYGLGYFNPLLSTTCFASNKPRHEAILDNVESVMQLIDGILKSDDIDLEGCRGGLRHVIGMVWAATQHEAWRSEEVHTDPQFETQDARGAL